MRRIISLLVGLLGAFVLAPLVVFSFQATQEQWRQSHALSAALTRAQSVTLTEFSRNYYDLSKDGPDVPPLIQQEVILQSKVASPVQIEALRSATGSFLVFSDGTLSIAGCYDPHHRVEIVQRDGSRVRIEICFGCRKFSFGRWREENIPGSWQGPLRAFFNRVGLPPRREGDYLALASEKMNR